METEIIHKSGTEIWLKKHGKEVWQHGCESQLWWSWMQKKCWDYVQGYQLPEVPLERSPGLRFSGNKPTWQKIPKSKQRQTRGRSLIRVIFVAEPKIEISVKYLWSESWRGLVLLHDSLWETWLVATSYSTSGPAWCGGQEELWSVQQLTEVHISHPIINSGFAKSWQGATSSPVPLISPGLPM